MYQKDDIKLFKKKVKTNLYGIQAENLMTTESSFRKKYQNT